VADLLKQELGVAEVDLIPGGRGEFTVWVGDEVVAQKNWLGFPAEQKVLEAVREALGAENL
jgi:predicted Rdx family selenoprotein